MLGDVGLQSIGLATGTSTAKSTEAPAATFCAADATGASALPFGRGDRGLHGHALRGRALVLDGRLHVHGRAAGRRRRRGDERRPLRHVHRIGRDDADVAVDAGARVPARGGLRGIVGAHGDHVAAAAEHRLRGDLVAEAHVAVGARAQLGAVDVDVGVRHHAVELDEDALALLGGGQREVLAVPADAGGQVAAVAQRRRVLIERALDAPVVRHVQRAPAGVGEGGLIRRRSRHP